ncbi:MAG TPA: hypothetical protein VIQ11_08320 [Mycobacterium sp.]
MKSPDAIGGTDAQQQEYAAKVRTIRADQLGDAHMGRLVSSAGHLPRRLLRRRREVVNGRNFIVLVWGWVDQTAVTEDAEITIHPEP